MSNDRQNPTNDSTNRPNPMDDGITPRDIILWNRIGRISVLLAERLDISPERAFDVFYESDTCERLRDERSGLYLMGDLYVVDEVIRELQEKQG